MNKRRTKRQKTVLFRSIGPPGPLADLHWNGESRWHWRLGVLPADGSSDDMDLDKLSPRVETISLLPYPIYDAFMIVYAHNLCADGRWYSCLAIEKAH